MLYQCGLISCNKCTILVWDIDSGEVVPGWGHRAYENSLYFLLKFVMNLKLLLKINFIN